MILFSRKILDTVVHGTTAVLSDPDSWELLGTADKLSFEVRAAQNGGTRPTLTVVEQESNDGTFWNARATLVSSQALTANQNQQFWPTDAGATPLGRFVRLSVTLGGTNPVTNLQIFVTGRAD